jgi:hypothetical protein
MPNKDFLENYRLYQKFKTEIPNDLRDFELLFDRPSVHLKCEVCGSDQTFRFDNRSYIDTSYNQTSEMSGKILHLDYRCAGCNRFHRYFLINLTLLN